MIADAIQKIMNISNVDLFKIAGRDFSSRKIEEIMPLLSKPITVHTLTAIVDFFNESVGTSENVDNGWALIHIVDPYTVKILEANQDETYLTRDHLLTADKIHREFEFDRYFDQERMIISLMTLFEQTDTLKDVIKVVAGLIVSQDVEINDDGVSQEVKVRKGTSRVEKITIENPILLRPIRTFVEIEQVESPYVLRIRDRNERPEIAIFEAGGGQWKNEAIFKIKEWLSERIEGAKILG